MTKAFLGALIALAIAAGPAQASVHVHGYLTTRDGTQLRYDVIRPDGPGPFPTLLNYEGYAAGSDATDGGVSAFSDRILQRGYALMGVSVRGTGCSQGTFDPFDATMGTDGYDAIEWIAKQAWSNGHVGMIGVSFGGITQLVTAADRPPHLDAIAPSSATSDLYRDVAYPGGILEYDFTFIWTGVQKAYGTEYAATGAPAAGDTECEQNYVNHEAQNLQPDYFIPTLALQNPFVDDANTVSGSTTGRSAPSWSDRAPNKDLSKINVPAYLHNQWQDEQLPARIWESLGMFKHPGQVWANFSNGNHGRDYYNNNDEEQTLAFFDHFVRGVSNGFQTKVPHLVVPLETQVVKDGEENVPSWAIERKSLDLKVKPRTFWFGSGATMGDKRPVRGESGDSYAYPLPSADVAEPGPKAESVTAGQVAWKAPVPPGGSVAYTSPALGKDMVLAGPASLNLWLQSTSTDVDVQATVTEVRPDGQETYVQRGWLRASHRKLDPKRSTALRPFQTHLRADSNPLVANTPTYMRLEVFPFAHAFRKGSRIRVWIDAPTGHTGFWAFQPTPNPGTETVLHDAAHPSRLVVGVVPGEVAHAPLPACDTLRNQPCRSDPLAG